MEESVRRCVCLGLCARVRERSFQGRLNEHLSLPLEISHGLCSLRSVIDITHPPPLSHWEFMSMCLETHTHAYTCSCVTDTHSFRRESRCHPPQVPPAVGPVWLGAAARSVYGQTNLLLVSFTQKFVIYCITRLFLGELFHSVSISSVLHSYIKRVLLWPKGFYKGSSYGDSRSVHP